MKFDVCDVIAGFGGEFEFFPGFVGFFGVWGVLNSKNRFKVVVLVVHYVFELIVFCFC